MFFRSLKELHGQQANLFGMKHLMSLPTRLCCSQSGLMTMKVPSRLAVVKRLMNWPVSVGAKNSPGDF